MNGQGTERIRRQAPFRNLEQDSLRDRFERRLQRRRHGRRRTDSFRNDIAPVDEQNRELEINRAAVAVLGAGAALNLDAPRL
jgi:hypothetical protein